MSPAASAGKKFAIVSQGAFSLTEGQAVLGRDTAVNLLVCELVIDTEHQALNEDNGGCCADAQPRQELQATHKHSVCMCMSVGYGVTRGSIEAGVR